MATAHLLSRQRGVKGFDRPPYIPLPELSTSSSPRQFLTFERGCSLPEGFPLMALSAQVKNINPWHRDLADWLILNGNSPGWNRRAAEHFKVGQAWISTVVHSDAFQDYYLRLRDEITKPQLFSAKERMTGILDQTLTKIEEKLENQGDTLTLGSLLDAADILAKRTGHGEGKSSDQTIVQVNTQVVTKEALEESRARMRGT